MDTNTFSQQAADYQRIEQAIHFLEANFQRQPSLEEIAQSVNLSPYHFQRMFRRWAGITPTQFLRFLTVEYTKERLQASRSVLGTTLDAGLSSPGRLHDLFVTFEAVTPGEYKNQGAGLTLAYGFHPTPFGDCLLVKSDRGISNLFFVGEDDRETALRQVRPQWPEAVLIERPAETEPLVHHLFAPSQQETGEPFHLLLKGTNFQIKVWQALLSIPEGMMVSYEDVARAIGQPTASRAVAGAIASNPIGYLIPCHRVINKTGKMHRYRWGAARKKAMLGWEACHAERSRGTRRYQIP